MRQILVVANQTLGGEQLKDVVRARIAQGPCEFTLVVPVAPASADVAADFMSEVLVDLSSSTYEAARIQAVRRLHAGIQALTKCGATIDGDIGVQNPVDAVGHCLAASSYDEIIVSTLPTLLSRWLLQDVPHRIQRKFKLPVTTVSARERVAT
jgi:hypothetical protein